MEKLTAKQIMAGEQAAVAKVENNKDLTSAKALVSAIAKAKKEHKAGVLAALAKDNGKGKAPTATADDATFTRLATEMRQLAQATPGDGALQVATSGWCESLVKLFGACHSLKQLIAVKTGPKILGYVVQARQVSAEVAQVASTLAALMQRFPELFARVMDVAACLDHVEAVERSAHEVAALKARNAGIDTEIDKLRAELMQVDQTVASALKLKFDKKEAKAAGKAMVKDLEADIARLEEAKGAPLSANA